MKKYMLSIQKRQLMKKSLHTRKLLAVKKSKKKSLRLIP